ncbi:efflux RND transporter permease subunit [Pseudomonas sp. H3(2019)]|uniref:efflux RND transporter permease subunit n=1 Tax=Pseudomonas sp. H3(2019) TaxID=2598724 RepID=UPI001195AE2C|nr:efflux RND transporter permease subunit [Pseudomonas sp. H3(2019)]TVT86083.1 efflux RND transporter permease subunit [Pseudomonas sp. H3(2019)]
MNFSSWSIRNPVPVIMLFVLLALIGLMAFSSLKVQDFPDVDLPTVTITTTLKGAAAAQLEVEVARKLESAVIGLQGVKHVYSKVQDGLVLLSVEFLMDRSVSQAMEDVRNAVNGVRSTLPADVNDPVIGKVEFTSTPFLIYTVADSRMDEEQLSWYIDNTMIKALRSVSGIGGVSRVGGLDREIRVALDPVAMASLNVSAAEISDQLAKTQREASGGRTYIVGGEQALRTIATAQSVDQLARMELSIGGGRRIRLDQVATVSDTTAERRSLAMLDGHMVVGVEITRSRNASEIEVADGVRKSLERLQSERPTLIVTQAYNTAVPVLESFRGSMNVLYEGALLAVLVVLWFLRNLRATLIVATALPLSLLPTFIGMASLGFTLNTVTLLALALVVGVLVDDAIVEIENIYRNLRAGKTPYQAAMEGANEIGMAVIATTLTLVAVFLPTAFMGGVPGKFFMQFGWTAAMAVLASLLVARMLTPMLAAYLLKPVASKAPEEGRLTKAYLKVASWCLSHRKSTIAMSVMFFIGSLLLAPLLSSDFVPPDDRSQTMVKLELVPGATLADTTAAAEQARAIILQQPYVTRVYTAIGGGAAGSNPLDGGTMSGVNKASLIVMLADRQDRQVRKSAIEGNLREALQSIPGVRLAIGLGAAGEKYQLAITSSDSVALQSAAQAIARDLRTLPGVGGVSSSASLIRPELGITVNNARAAELDVTATDIANTLRVSTVGEFDIALAKLNLPERQVPIVVRLPEGLQHDLNALRQLKIPTANGSKVMLSQVADISLSSGPSQIDRYDGARVVVFDVELNGRSLGDVSAAVDELPSVAHLPPGISRASFGDTAEMQKLFAGFLLAMLTGVVCIYMVLVLLFRDFMQPMTIMVALPLSIGGAFVALLVGHSSLSLPTMIGLIMLMGIATKNSILLVDYAITAIRNGASRNDALLMAARSRVRPIVMTSIAMGAGMLPVALGIGIDPSFRSPMAIAVIGGLVTSTVLSLLVVPVVFTCFDDLKRTLRRLLKGKNKVDVREESYSI